MNQIWNHVCSAMHMLCWIYFNPLLWISSFNPFQPSVAFHIETRHDFQCSKGKVQYLVFSNFLLVLTIFPFWEEDWTLDYNSMEFWNFLKSYVDWQLVSHLVFTVFIINNQVQFHLSWKEHLVRYLQAPKYYEHGCNFRNDTHGSWYF